MVPKVFEPLKFYCMMVHATQGALSVKILSLRFCKFDTVIIKLKKLRFLRCLEKRAPEMITVRYFSINFFYSIRFSKFHTIPVYTIPLGSNREPVKINFKLRLKT